jgi:hypothetical protein
MDADVHVMEAGLEIPVLVEVRQRRIEGDANVARDGGSVVLRVQTEEDGVARSHDRPSPPSTRRRPSCSPSPRPPNCSAPLAATLRYRRHLGTGGHCFRLGRRVLYRRDDLRAWINARHDES